MTAHHPVSECVGPVLVHIGGVIQELRYSNTVHQPAGKSVGLVLPKLRRGLVQEIGDVARDPEHNSCDSKDEADAWNAVDGGIGLANAEIHRQLQVVQEHIDPGIPVAEMAELMGGNPGKTLDACVCVAILVQDAFGEAHPVMRIGDSIDLTNVLHSLAPDA